MAPHAEEAAAREQRLLAMMEAISRSLSGSVPIPEAFARITEAARDLLDFQRVALLLAEGPDAMRVHAAAHGVSWTEGRLLQRSECSERLWIPPGAIDRLIDVTAELDPAYPMDREIIERGTRSIVRVPLTGRGGPFGFLAFSNAESDAFDDQDVRVASAVAGLVTLALEHQRILEAEVRRVTRLATVQAILPQIAQAREQAEIVTVIERLTRDVLRHVAVAVGVIHSSGARMYAINPLGTINTDVTLEVMEQQLGIVTPRGYVLVHDMQVLDEATRRMRIKVSRGEEPFDFDAALPDVIFNALTRIGIRSQVRAAIRNGGATVGVLIFSALEPDFYTEEDAILAVRLAEQISLTLAHEQIEDEQQRASAASARALALEARVATLQRELEAARGPHAVIGVSRSWQEVLAQATRVAHTETTVLLTGESGTGKEVAARFIHHASKRSGGPFVAINCAALPEQLLEAELFGHEKGAFTGAAAARTGRIEQAAGGVLFLDEVGEMSPTVQAKFLRVLQEREFQRLGSARVIKADVRIIAATNRDLKAAIASGGFREDLYYRLHVFAIHLSPLRDRPDDVLALADHFLKELGPALGHAEAGMTGAAREALRDYDWPGNVRELRNVIERALILSDGELIHPRHLAVAPAPKRSTAPAVSSPARAAADDEENGDGIAAPAVGGGIATLADGPLPETGVDLEALERSLVQRAMTQSAGNKSKAARLLGLTRAQLYSRLEKYELS